MLKQFIYLSFFLLANSLMGQVCSVDYSITKTDIVPDTFANFKTAYVNKPYEQVVQLRMMKDTCANVPPLGNACGFVKYGEVLEITNLPPGFTYKCEPTNCQVVGGGNGCVKIYGTPTISEENKTFELQFKLKLVAKIETPIQIDPFQIDTIVKGYRIKVEPEVNNVKDFDFAKSVFVSPNPLLNGKSGVYFNLNSSSIVSFQVFNLIGDKVLSFEKGFNAGQNKIEIDKALFKQGVYFVQLNSGNNSVTKKLIIK